MRHWARPKKKKHKLYRAETVTLRDFGLPGDLVSYAGEFTPASVSTVFIRPRPIRFVSHGPKSTAPKRPDRPRKALRGFAQ